MAQGDKRDEARGLLRVLPGGASLQAPRDDQLVRAFLVGDRVALGELLRRHERRVLALVRRYAASADESRDLVQKAFLRALEAARKSLEKGRGRDAIPFAAWLLRIAVNLGKNAARDAARWRRAPLEAIDGASSVPPAAEEGLIRAERERLVRQAVLSLPTRQRQVLTLRIDAELSFAEIADTLDITEGNARVHFHHAARRLRRTLAAAEERTP